MCQGVPDFISQQGQLKKNPWVFYENKEKQCTVPQVGPPTLLRRWRKMLTDFRWCSVIGGRREALQEMQKIIARDTSFFIHLFICAYIVLAVSPPCPLHSNSSYQLFHLTIIYKVVHKNCKTLAARSPVCQLQRCLPAWFVQRAQWKSQLSEAQRLRGSCSHHFDYC
jgi:hypothetical protein